MSVRKRIWKTSKGEAKEAWVVAYSRHDKDGNLKGHIKTFRRKKDADAWHAKTVVEVKEGRHTPDSSSITVKEAGDIWIKNGEANSLERTSLDQYRWPLTKHIVPHLGHVKLSKLTARWWSTSGPSCATASPRRGRRRAPGARRSW